MSFVTCPHHPDKKILAYQQTAFSTPCTIELDHGSMEIELDGRVEFERDMETTVIVCYLCSVDDCDWSILPEQLSQYARESPAETDPPHVDTLELFDPTSGTLQGIDPSTPTSWPEEESHKPADDVASVVEAAKEELARREGESPGDFNRRRAEFHRLRREALRPDDSEYESPLTKLARVFGGS